MAWVEVQECAQKVGVGSGGLLTTAAFGSPPTAGNAIIVAYVINPSGSGTVSCSDSATGNTYLYLGGSEVGTGSINASTTSISSPTVMYFGAFNINTTSSFTISCGCVGTGLIQAIEFSGGTSTADGSGSTNHGTNSTTMTTGSFSTSNANDLLLIGAAITYNGSSNPTITTEPSGFTFSNHLAYATVPVAGATDYEIVSATQSSINPTWVGTNYGSGWATVAIALKAAAGGGSGNSGGLTPLFNNNTVLCPIWNTSIGLYDPKSTL